jgi:hypothetical protein
MPARIELPEAEIVRRYLEEKPTPCPYDLAKDYSVSMNTIRRVLRRNGVLRTAGEALSLSTRKKLAARALSDRDKTPLAGRDADDCRMDPAWEAHKGIAKVNYCRECLLPFAELWRHVRCAHPGIDYRRKWPKARMTTYRIQAMIHQQDGDRQSDLSKIMTAAAAKYLTAEQLREFRLDVNWQKKNQDLRDHVVCLDCGFIAGLSLFNHLTAVHKWDRKQYRHRYPKAPMRSIAYLEKLPVILGTKQVAGTGNGTDVKKSRGRHKEPEEGRQYFKVGRMVEEKLASGKELTTARRATARETEISYSSVVLYHKKFRRLGRTAPGTEIQA